MALLEALLCNFVRDETPPCNDDICSSWGGCTKKSVRALVGNDHPLEYSTTTQYYYFVFSDTA